MSIKTSKKFPRTKKHRTYTGRRNAAPIVGLKVSSHMEGAANEDCFCKDCVGAAIVQAP